MRELIDEYLRYEKETGKFFWIKKPSSKVYVGDEAGRLIRTGHKQICIKGHLILAHRLVWFIETGVWPIGVIDHIDRNPVNNVFSNLRDVPQGENIKNSRVRKDSKSGHKGIRFFRGRWSVHKWECKRRKFKGSFDTLEEALALRDEIYGEEYGKLYL